MQASVPAVKAATDKLFDILMFFGNNPEYRTASDVVEIRRIKANLVSVNVDKLVREGYLERREAPDDRRKTLLFCTEKAQDVIEKGRMIQSIFKILCSMALMRQAKRSFSTCFMSWKKIWTIS